MLCIAATGILAEDRDTCGVEISHSNFKILNFIPAKLKPYPYHLYQNDAAATPQYTRFSGQSDVTKVKNSVIFFFADVSKASGGGTHISSTLDQTDGRYFTFELVTAVNGRPSHRFYSFPYHGQPGCTIPFDGGNPPVSIWVHELTPKNN